MSKKGQVNIIAVIGMIAATIIALMNLMNYVNELGLSSAIYINAQNSIYQVAGMKDYILQQAQYNFDKAQLMTGLNLVPSTTSCGYINGTQLLPQLGIPKIYYWNTPSGQTCLPYNSEIEYAILKILSQPSFSTIPVNNSPDFKEYIDINLTHESGDLYQGSFTSPVFNGQYVITLDKSQDTVSVTYNGNTVASGPVLSTYLSIGNYSFLLGPVESTVTGVLNQPAYQASFFSGSFVSPSSQYGLITFNGQQAIVYSNQTNGMFSFHLAILQNPYAYTLSEADGGKVYNLINGSDTTIDGEPYLFLITNDTNGIFSLSPVDYTTLAIQPNFVFMKYLVNSFQLSGSQNLLFPSEKNLYVSLFTFPLYNPQVCVSSNVGTFSIQDCLSLAGQVSSQDYLSNLLQLSIAFVNQSFPIGQISIQGFPQYLIYNYLENVIHGVNMRTVSVNGRPKYDWYSSLIFAIGSPNGQQYLENEISCAKENYYGTTIYDCSQTPSCLSTCRSVLSQTLGYAINNLLSNQEQEELSFLSGYPFSVSVLNVSVSAAEAANCGSGSASYSYTYQPPSSAGTSSEEVLGVPISLIFGYKNGLKLTPTEGCGLQEDPQTACYPGFSTTLSGNSKSGFDIFSCCSPILANQFLNRTCIANLGTNNRAVAEYINYSTGPQNNGICSAGTQDGQTYYYCNHFIFNETNPLFEPQGYISDWVLHSNSCPSTITIAGQTFSQGNKDYDILSEYGGGTSQPTYSLYNWTSAYIDNLDLANISVHMSANLGGAAPNLAVIFSSGNISSSQKLSSPAFAVDVDIHDGSTFAYNSNAGMMTNVGAGAVYASTGNNQVVVDKSCLSGECTVVAYENSREALNQSFSSGSETESLGISTGSLPSNVIVPEFFVTNYFPSYAPKIIISSYQPATFLNRGLPSASAFNISYKYLGQTYFNVISIENGRKLPASYQLEVPLTSQFYVSQMFPNEIKVFAVYSLGNVKELSWWNETPISVGSPLWINITNNPPRTIYIVYGQGVAYNSDSYADNGSKVFPVFFSNITLPSSESFSLLYPAMPSDNSTVSSAGLVLQQNSPIPPYIYNVSSGRFYEQFACVTKSSMLLVNASYASSLPSINLQDLYGAYDPLYPNLYIIGTSTPSAQASSFVTTFYATNLLQGATWEVTYDGIEKTSTNPTISFVTPLGTYPFTIGGSVAISTCYDYFGAPSVTSGNELAGGSVSVTYDYHGVPTHAPGCG